MDTVRVAPPTAIGRYPHVFLFRIVGLYFGLYCLATLPLPYSTAFQAPLVRWVGQQVFGLTIVVQAGGSGDTAFHYVQAFTLGAVALVGALMWSIAFRQSSALPRLHEWLQLLIRATLIFAMLAYGGVKVAGLQFEEIPLHRLAQPLGDMSPMALLGAFMGYSQSYSMFAGLVELAGGLLLFYRRTTLLGALLCAAAMSHVLMLNLSYDVPVKLHAAHLVALALVLVFPEVPRLIDFFILNRPVEPVAIQPLLPIDPRLRVAGRVLQSLFVISLILGLFAVSWSTTGARGTDASRSSLYGVWEVEQFIVDGVERAPLLDDASRWRHLVLDRNDLGSIQLMNDEREFYRLAVEPTKQRITLTPVTSRSRQPMTLEYQQLNPEQLRVLSDVEGRTLDITLQQRSFLLTSRSFTWITEIPFNH